MYLFYSFHDLGFAFGWQNVENQLREELHSKRKKKIEQHRSITGTLKIADSFSSRLNHWKIRDLSGLTNTGLKDFASSLGTDMNAKTLLDDLKSRMDLALLTRTEVFLDYSLDDVLVLEEISKRFLTLVNNILSKTLLFPDRLLFTESTLPLTTGSLVAKTFEKYIFYHAQKSSGRLYYNFLKRKNLEVGTFKSLGSNSCFYLALWSLNLLKKGLKKHEEYVDLFEKVLLSGSVETGLERSIEHVDEFSACFFKSPFVCLPYSGASIESISYRDRFTTSLLNCLVSGGRANNELPSEYNLEYILNVDLQSCYGSALSCFEFPVGLPTIIAYAPNEKKLTLKEFLLQYEEELVPNLYKITVSGKLTFEQDLIFSKLTKNES